MKTAFICLALGASAAAVGDFQRKNVLFFAVDDLRPELGCMSIPGAITPQMRTENIDALAKRSLVLTKNYVQQAVCSPSRTSLLTGRRPDSTQIYDLQSYFRTYGGNYTTIPELFKINGYRTIGMGKIFHPGAGSRFNSSFPGDDIPFSWSKNASGEYPYFHAPNLGYWSSKDGTTGRYMAGDSYVAVPPDVEAQYPLPDTQIADNALKTLDDLENSLPEDGNFFLAVGFHKPHLPFVFPERFAQNYPMDEIKLPSNPQAPKDMPPVAWSAWGELRAYNDIAPLNNSGKPGDTLPEKKVLGLRQAYYSAVSHMDDELGRVLKKLWSSKFANNTVISLFGDHGWQLGEHGEWCKHTNFELATRAPMMVHVPGRTEGGIFTKQYSEHVDLLPTLAELAMGKKLEACPKPRTASQKVKLCAEGVSLAPLIDDPDTPVKVASFSQYPRSWPPSPGLSTDTTESHRCVTGECTMGYSVAASVEGKPFRYTAWVQYNANGSGKANFNNVVGRELYDHSIDAAENVNRVDNSDYSAIVEKLHKMVKDYALPNPSPAI